METSQVYATHLREQIRKLRATVIGLNDVWAQEKRPGRWTKEIEAFQAQCSEVLAQLDALADSGEEMIKKMSDEKI